MPELTGYRKAFAGAFVAAAGWFAGAFIDGMIEAPEWAALPLLLCGGFGLVAVTKNTP